jgi:hypothetical protein
MKIHTKDKAEFMKVKKYLDGAVFWREIENNKVEIKMAFPNKQAKNIIKSLKD